MDRRRIIVLSALAIIFAIVGVRIFSGTRATDEQSLGREQVRAQLTLLVSALCRFDGLVSEDKLGPAKNLYFDEVHSGSHAAALLIGDTDRAVEADLLVAHSKVEQDLATLAPRLRESGPAFTAVARKALTALDIKGANRPCL